MTYYEIDVMPTSLSPLSLRATAVVLLPTPGSGDAGVGAGGGPRGRRRRGVIDNKVTQGRF